MYEEKSKKDFRKQKYIKITALEIRERFFDKLGVCRVFYVTPHPPQAVPLPLEGKARLRLPLEGKLSTKLTDEVKNHPDKFKFI